MSSAMSSYFTTSSSINYFLAIPKTVTFVQSVKKLRQGFSHPILLSRADSAMYKDKLQIKA